jgi:hypothetical protein
MYPIALSYLHMLQTFDVMWTNSMKNNIALIILQCCPIPIHCNSTTCAITQCIAIVKTRATNICAYAHPLCAVRGKKVKYNKKNLKPWKKRPKVNPILSHVNHTFSILDLQIGPQGFEHTHHTLEILLIFNMKKKVQFKLQFASNWSLGFWSLDPCPLLPAYFTIILKLWSRVCCF